MDAADLVPGEIVTIEGCDYEFHCSLAPENDEAGKPDDLQFLSVRSRRAHNFAADDFFALYAAGRDVDAENDTPLQRKRREQRLFWTKIYEHDPVLKSERELERFIGKHEAKQPHAELGVRPGTLRRWLRERGIEGDRRPRQMGDRRRSNAGRKKLSSEVQTVFDDHSALFWRDRRMTKQDVVYRVHAEIERLNASRRLQGTSLLIPPSRASIYRRLDGQRNYENVLSRRGRIIADRTFKSIKGSTHTTRPLEIVEFDEKQMDIIILDPSRTFELGRPWLTVGIDVYSRQIVGYHFSFKDPSVQTMMACLRNCIRGNPHLRKRFPSPSTDWEAFGLPQTIKLDNSWANQGSALLDACQDLRVSQHWARNQNPNYKGIVERFFRRMDQ